MGGAPRSQSLVCALANVASIDLASSHQRKGSIQQCLQKNQTALLEPEDRNGHIYNIVARSQEYRLERSNCSQPWGITLKWCHHQAHLTKVKNPHCPYTYIDILLTRASYVAALWIVARGDKVGTCSLVPQFTPRSLQEYSALGSSWHHAEHDNSLQKALA